MHYIRVSYKGWSHHFLDCRNKRRISNSLTSFYTIRHDLFSYILDEIEHYLFTIPFGMSFTGLVRVRGPLPRVDIPGSDFELSAPVFTCEALHVLKEAFAKDASKKQEWIDWLLPQVESLKVVRKTVLYGYGEPVPPADDLPRKLLAMCHDAEEHMGISFTWTRYPRAPGEGVKVHSLKRGLFRWCLRAGRCTACREAGDHPVVHWSSMDQMGLPHGCSSDLAPQLANALHCRVEDMIEPAPELQNFSLQQRENWSSVMAATCLRVISHVLEDKKTKWRCTLVLDHIFKGAYESFNCSYRPAPTSQSMRWEDDILNEGPYYFL